jgi:large subunit ribosomal protein L35Ae
MNAAHGIWEEEPVLTGIVNRGRHLSYQRGKRNTNPGTSLIKIEGVDDTNAAK